MRLSDKKNNTPIPFRDSKLTRILQPALEGNSKVSIICNISSFIGSHSETLSTVNFAKRAKKIKQVVTQNHLNDNNSLITKYQHEISELQQRLRDMENRLQGQVNLTTKIDYSENILDLIEKKEKAEQEVDEILQEKLKLEKELKMMRSFILNSDEIKPSKRLLSPEVLKKEVMKGLINKIAGMPMTKNLDAVDTQVFQRRESLLTEGIDDILGELEVFNEKQTDPLIRQQSVKKEVPLFGALLSKKKTEEVEETLNCDPCPTETAIPALKCETFTEPQQKTQESGNQAADKAKIAEQAKLIQELTEALKSQDSIIKQMTEVIEEKTSEVNLLKEEVKLHKRTILQLKVVSKFSKNEAL